MGGSGGGSSQLANVAVESQDYRAQIRDAVIAAESGAQVVDPAEVVEARGPDLHPPDGPVDWRTDESVAAMFAECVRLAAEADVVISYLPTASMGSAVELHAAREAGRLVVVVAPGRMRSNWVVRSYAHYIFDDVSSLAAWLLARQTETLSLSPASADGIRGGAAQCVPTLLEGSITFLYSRAFDSSRRFYADDLRLPLRSDKGAVVFYSLPAGRGARGSAASLGVVREGISAAAKPPVSAAAAGSDTVMICLLTADVDTAFARAISGRRCTIEQPPQVNTRFGISNALLRDPDGYLVELQSFTDPAEQRRFAGGEA